jgi:hypothetical protein
MNPYHISNQEIAELKETMGFRVGMANWTEFVDNHPDGCSNTELIVFVKEQMNPPYEQKDLDGYLQSILMTFVNFIRGNRLDTPIPE